MPLPVPSQPPSLSPPAAPTHRRAGGYGLLLAVAIAAFFFAAIAPTLTWLQFASGSENLNVETVLEMRRGGPWLIPHLLGAPRTIKPPLTAWMTAAAVSPATVQAAASPDRATRDQALRELTWQVRWPALLSACLMLVAVYELGRSIGDWRLGCCSALACGSTLLFLRYSRSATTDVQLALWVAVCNLFLAKVLFEGRWWIGCLGAGVATGLALMSKGPVTWVQSIVPVLLFVLWRQWMARRSPVAEPGPEPQVRRMPVAPLIAGVLLMLAVAMPWPATVVWHYGGQWKAWWTEISRVGARDEPPDKWYTYVSLLPLMAPWTIWFLAGCVVAIRDHFRRPAGSRQVEPILLALVLTCVPLLIMSCSRDKVERYLLPMVAPASILVGRGLLEHFESWRRSERVDRVLTYLHWAGLAAAAIGVAVAGAVGAGDLKTMEQLPSYSLPLAISAAAAGLVLVVAGILWQRRRPEALLVITVPLMLGVQALFVYGYGQNEGGRNALKPLADRILERYPAAQVYVDDAAPKPRRDLSICLGQVVQVALQPAALPASADPQVLVRRQRRRAAAPPTPAGWTHFAVEPGDRDRWHAYVRR